MRITTRILAIFIGLTALSAFPGLSRGEGSSLYLSAYLGLNVFEDLDYTNTAVPVSGTVETDNDVSFGGALGFRLSKAFSVEAEVSHASTDLGTLSSVGGTGPVNGEVDALTFLFNGYFDFETDWAVKPYLGAGAGFGIFDANIRDGGSNLTQNSSGEDWSFIYQVGGGLKYQMNDNTSLVSGYRYIGSSDIEFDQTNIDYSAHELRVGLQYDLPVNWDR